MKFIATHWYIWLVLMIVSALLFISMFKRKSPEELMEGYTAEIYFFITWIFKGLFILSIILNIIEYIRR